MCHPLYLALRLRLPLPLPAPTCRQPRTGCATLPKGQRRCSACCTLASGSLHDGVQRGRMPGCSSAACSMTRESQAHGMLQVHSGRAMPRTAETAMGPK
jgi:hypothetical protein